MEVLLIGYIYKIQNKLNNTVYIGQTIQDVHVRWRRHICDAFTMDSQTYFHRALRKYGVNNFDFSVIEQIPNYLLNERQIYWIAFYDSYKHGYNSTEGGSEPPNNSVPIICLQTLQIFDSSADAGRKLNLNSCHIRQVCAHKHTRVTVGGFHFMDLKQYNELGPVVRIVKNQLTSKRVKRRSTGIQYSSVLKASKQTGIGRSTIKRHCEKENGDWEYC